MLSDDSLDVLMQPIIDRQESINTLILKRIAQRIKQIGTLLPSDVNILERLLFTGVDARKMNAEIARLTGLNINDIKRLIKTVAADAYKDAKPYYDYRKRPYIPFNENVELQRVVEAVTRQTLETYINLSNAAAFMWRDPTDPTKLIPTPLAQVYQSVVDEAIQIVQSGTLDYNTMMRRSLHQLINSGYRRVTYQAESGRIHTQRLDTALRRNLMDGVREINQQVQDITGEQFEADGKEISVHMNSAPDHEPIQGHQFTNEEYAKLQNQEDFEDYNGVKFKAIRRPIGIWNCRHFTFSVILGLMKPNYTQAELNAMIAKNKEGYTLPNGSHLTMYECTQHMRQIETQIRYAKEAQMTFKEAGDMKRATKYQTKINELISEYNIFSTSVKLKARPEKYYVPGYVKLKKSEYVF